MKESLGNHSESCAITYDVYRKSEVRGKSKAQASGAGFPSSKGSAPNSLIINTYSALRNEIAQVLAAGKERARQAVEREKARTYWEVGRCRLP